WVARHAVPRVVGRQQGQQWQQQGGRQGRWRGSGLGAVLTRESLACLPRELHPLLLELGPLGVSRPEREECDSMMAEMAAAEAASYGRPLLPWEVPEGPAREAAGRAARGQQQPRWGAYAQAASTASAGPGLGRPRGPGCEGEGEETADGGGGGGGGCSEEAAAGGGGVRSGGPSSGEQTVVERYEVAEEQLEDGSRVVEELKVVAGRSDAGLTRAAKALQAAMARLRSTGAAEPPPASPGATAAAQQWVNANPRAATFDDIARQALQRPQNPPSTPSREHRPLGGSTSPGPSSPTRTSATHLPAPATPLPAPAPPPGARPSVSGGPATLPGTAAGAGAAAAEVQIALRRAQDQPGSGSGSCSNNSNSSEVDGRSQPVLDGREDPACRHADMQLGLGRDGVHVRYDRVGMTHGLRNQRRIRRCGRWSMWGGVRRVGLDRAHVLLGMWVKTIV
ncbi:hypothetical protein Agub_g6279, partial [Astrephomene gubernaculifera]